MALYKGIVRQFWEYEIDIDAESNEDAIKKIKDMYNDDSIEGVFILDYAEYAGAEIYLKDTDKVSHHVAVS